MVCDGQQMLWMVASSNSNSDAFSCIIIIAREQAKGEHGVFICTSYFSSFSMLYNNNENIFGKVSNFNNEKKFRKVSNFNGQLKLSRGNQRIKTTCPLGKCEKKLISSPE